MRFSGCNLGCTFCDTDHQAYREMSDSDIIGEIINYPTRFVVLTGGEPALQVDDDFIALLHGNGYEVAMETNGTMCVPEGIDWLTVSPKQSFVGNAARTVIKRCNEIKCVFDGKNTPDDCGIEADYRYLQPCDTGNEQRNKEITTACIDYILRHPQWRLSLQTHKLTGIK